jgi:hypothetical protein
MKTFKQFQESYWTGYTAKGMKKKGNRMVPSVPVSEDGVGGIAVSGPTNVTGPQSATDPVSATAIDMKKKKRYSMIARKVPN